MSALSLFFLIFPGGRRPPLFPWMPDISVQKICRAEFTNAKRKNYHKICSANENQDRYCNISPELIMPEDYTISIVLHTHNSSKDYRISAPAYKWGNYPCITCKTNPHSHKIRVRYPVLVSSSILNRHAACPRSYLLVYDPYRPLP